MQDLSSGQSRADELAEVVLVARGIATAVAPAEGLTDVQASLLEAIANALTGYEVDYHDLEPLGPADLAEVLAAKDDDYRQRIVHHMVLGELVLRPLPHDVALRVAKYAQALGIDDRFVRVARRYAQGAYGLAWMDLRRSGFAARAEQPGVERDADPDDAADPFEPPSVDPELEARWRAFRDLPEDTLGRSVWEMYDGRGFPLPGNPAGPSEYLARHDFVHVLADYGTDLKGELEVFALIGRADPDPKGFAWLATLVGLFETGYIENTGFFQRDLNEHNLQAPGMNRRIADAIKRGKFVCAGFQRNLFDVDYYELAEQPVDDVRARLNLTPKSEEALDAGSAGLFARAGMSEHQRRMADELARREGERT
jgi:hypothetical protein